MKTTKYFISATIAALFFTLSGCSDADEDSGSNWGKNATEEMMKENGHNPDDAIFDNPSRMRSSNYVYTQSNESGTNHILVFRKNESGTLVWTNNVASGGAGNGAGLGSQGSIIIDDNHRFLYAVNAGSNSISSFRVMNNGNLMLKETISSGGITPVSLSMHGDYLYVVHSGDSSINGFRVSQNGRISPIAGSHKPLSSDVAGPAQISFSPNGNYLYVSEKMTNTISVFSVNSSGVAGQRVSVPSVGNTPFGFDFARDSFMIVSNAEGGMDNLSSVTSYLGINSGNIAAVNGAVPNNQTAACWVATTTHGRYAFVTNTGSDSVSSYYINEDGSLYIVEESFPSGDTPIDLVVSADDYHVYVLCTGDNTIQQYTRTKLGGLIHTGQTAIVPENAAGLATW